MVAGLYSIPFFARKSSTKSMSSQCQKEEDKNSTLTFLDEFLIFSNQIQDGSHFMQNDRKISEYRVHRNESIEADGIFVGRFCVEHEKRR